MRINAGKFKGFPIQTSPLPGTRPTLDKVKQAIFNILGRGVHGANVLDLFSGFGALGLEAISRGASWVAFVDKDRRCIDQIQANLSKMQVQEGARVLPMDVFSAISQLETEGARFSVVLSDAPYAEPSKQLTDRLLKSLGESASILPLAILILQHKKGQDPPEEARWHKLRSYSYGITSLTAYRKVS